MNDAYDSVLIENNRVAPEWVCNPFSSDSTVFNETRIASVIAALMLTLGINGPLTLGINGPLTLGINGPLGDVYRVFVHLKPQPTLIFVKL